MKFFLFNFLIAAYAESKLSYPILGSQDFFFNLFLKWRFTIPPLDKKMELALVPLLCFGQSPFCSRLGQEEEGYPSGEDPVDFLPAVGLKHAGFNTSPSNTNAQAKCNIINHSVINIYSLLVFKAFSPCLTSDIHKGGACDFSFFTTCYFN